MAKADRSQFHATLEAVFEAERKLRELSRQLIKAPHGQLIDLLAQSILDAAKRSPDEQALRLVAISRLLRDVPGPKAIDLMIDMLGSDSEEARAAAGAAIEDVAYDRMGEVQKGIERALKRLPVGHMALCELPFIVLNVAEDALPMLRPFLALPDPDAVGATIDVLVELADPAAIPLIAPLVNDARPVQIEGEEDEGEALTVGELAKDAIDALQEVERIMKGEAEE